MEKIPIAKNTVQETLILPLFARKLSTEFYPHLFQDTKSVALMEKIDYDFSELEKKTGAAQRFGALEVAMRQSDLACEIKTYLQEHPKASVVNLGCGLDRTAEMCDNGECRIYNLDYPDVISLREKLLPEEARVRNMAVDLKDTSWFEQISRENGTVFFAAGVFYYFSREEAVTLLAKMARFFPGGRLIFDTAGKAAVKRMTKSWIEQAGIQNVDAFFYVGNLEKDLKPWLPDVKISERGYMLGYNDLKDKSVSRLFRFLARIGDTVMRMKIIRMDFIRKPREEMG